MALEAHHDLRQTGAREEFARWREAHPNFTSQELLDAWKRIRFNRGNFDCRHRSAYG